LLATALRTYIRAPLVNGGLYTLSSSGLERLFFTIESPFKRNRRFSFATR
jgi:hypothetical protein